MNNNIHRCPNCIYPVLACYGVFPVTGQHILSITCPAPDQLRHPGTRQHSGHSPQVVITFHTLLACWNWIVWSNYPHDNAGLGNDNAAVLGWGFSQFSPTIHSLRPAALRNSSDRPDTPNIFWHQNIPSKNIFTSSLSPARVLLTAHLVMEVWTKMWNCNWGNKREF